MAGPPEYPAVRFGFENEQQAFVERHREFQNVFEELTDAIERMFNRVGTLESASDKVVFFTGRLIAEEFMEIVLLSANGYGNAALRILRGMYERLVTAKYLSINPEEADAFINYNCVHEWKVISRAMQIWPDGSAFSPERVEKAKAAFDAVKDAFQETACRKCGTKRPQGSWTKKSLPELAIAAGGGMDKLYLNCYLIPTLQVHATAKAVFTRVQANEDQLTFKADAQRDHADAAFMSAKTLVMLMLHVQNNHFQLGLDEYLDAVCTKVLDKMAGAN